MTVAAAGRACKAFHRLTRNIRSRVKAFPSGKESSCWFNVLCPAIMPELGGIEAIRRIREECPGLRVTGGG
ncbi:MAG: hypothetical protein ACREEE_16400 [Dongiaceae bacterium]